MNKASFKISDAFEIETSSTLELPGISKSTAHVPEKKFFAWPKNDLVFFNTWYLSGGTDPLYLFGEPGIGKTEFPLQYAARLNIPVYQLDIQESTTFAAIEGSIGVRSKDNGTESFFNYGPLPRAMGIINEPGFLLLNEIHNNPGLLAGIHDAMDGRKHVLTGHGNEVITPQWPFRIILTGNTSLLGSDFSGLHPTALQADIASLDRCYKYQMGFPDIATQEFIVLHNVPKLDNAAGRPLLRSMITVAEKIREQYIGRAPDHPDALEVSMSMRSLIRWANLYVQYTNSGIEEPLTRALMHALTAVASNDTQIGINKIVDAVFGNKNLAAA